MPEVTAPMKRMLAFAYGVVCYAAFFATSLYSVGFLANFGVPKGIDSGPDGPLSTALMVDGMLLMAFALQHSIMARPWFKRMWTRVVPEPVERSTYVLFSSLALLYLFKWWRPIGGVIWSVEGSAAIALHILYAVGLMIVFVSTFLINHFDLFGLRQVFLYLTGRPYTHLKFRTPFFYRYVRHPLYVGWLLTFWATPTMTAAHLFFAVATTAYILIAIQFEEADLIAVHGDTYRRYRRQVPMIVPSLPSDSADRTFTGPADSMTSGSDRTA